MLTIVHAPIDVRALEAAVRHDTCGGVVSFLGMVRERDSEGKLVDRLSYEAYEPLAIETFAQIAKEVAERWSGVRVAIVHRVGELHVGEIAVAVSVASPHRSAAFDACAYAIDQLKRRAPIWKKEHYRDGSPSRWCANDRTETIAG